MNRGSARENRGAGNGKLYLESHLDGNGIEGAVVGAGPLANVLTRSPQEKPVLSVTIEVIDSAELAKRLSVPESWIRSRTHQNRTSDPIPHYRLGRYIRFSWGSVELRDWLSRQLVSTDRQWSRRRT
jgi:hypothetical protein